MAAKIEFAWSMGSYEYVHWIGTAEEWDKETAESLTALGQQWYAAKTCILAGRDNPDILPQESAQELIERELGGKVVSVSPGTPAAPDDPQPGDKPWTVKVETPTPDWEKPAGAVKPAPKPLPVISGFEDF